MDEKRLLDIQTAQRGGMYVIEGEGAQYYIVNKHKLIFGIGYSEWDAWQKHTPRFSENIDTALDLIKDYDYLIHHSTVDGMYRILDNEMQVMSKASTIPHAITLAWNKWWESENNA